MHLKRVLSFILSERSWAIVAAISGAVAAIAASLTVYQAISASREDRESKRPYFTLSAPGIKPLPQSPPFRIQITMDNIGVHPASDLVGKILIIDRTLTSPPEFSFDFSVANEIPAETPTPWYNDVYLPQNVPPQYVVLAIKYRDPILKKFFTQIFYMKWDGVLNGQTQPDFVHVTVEEKATLQRHLTTVLRGLG